VIETALRERAPGGMAYDIIGDRGPYLLAVHGGPGMDHVSFRPWLDFLAERVRLVYLDLPGHGRSAPATDYSLEAMADALDALRAHLGVERVLVLGASYGGFISLVYALRHPHHVAGLLLVDTAPSYGFRAESVEVARRRGTPEMLTALDRLWNDTLGSDAEFQRDWTTILPLYFHSAPLDEIRRLAGATTYRLATRKAVLPTFRDYDVRERLDEISPPALVAVGRHDWITSVGQAEALAGRLANARLAVFEQSGHMPFVDEPEEFRRVVNDWLGARAQVGAGGSR
jgi:proline iminopeptidase